MKKFVIKYLFILSAVCFAASSAALLAACNTSGNTSISDAVTNHTHVYGEWVTVKLPTCTEEGESERYCLCGDKQTVALSALGHDYVQHSGQAATCSDVGWNDYQTCSRCDYSDYTEIPAIGHNFGEWSVTREATCSLEGEEIRVCLNDSTHTETRELPIVNHKAGTWITGEKATCETDGLKILRCAVCLKVLDTRVVSAPGHDFGEWVQTTAPTCTECGIETKTCKRDNLHVETRETEALGHDYGEWVQTTPPTCTECGIETKTCKRDNLHVETRETEALGHDYGEWILTKPPTCTECGIETRICKRDGLHFETRETAAAGHGYTYTAQGDFHTAVCKVCGDRIENLPHEFEDGICTDCGFKEPTKIELSYTKTGDSYAVSGIGSVTETEIIIPSEYNGLPVTAIASDAFRGCTTITKITLPDGILSIGEGAFSDCTQLKNINIPESVILIDIGAFSGCSLISAEFEVKEWNIYNDKGVRVGHLTEENFATPELAGTALRSYSIYVWKHE